MADEDAWLDEWARDPDLRRAGQRYEAELRAEAAEYEQLAAKDRLRDRDLADVAAELLARGDLVTITLVTRSFTGEVAHVGKDLVVLRTTAGDVDVHLHGRSAFTVVEPARVGGHGSSWGARSFAARLAEHEMAGQPVELGARLALGTQPAGWVVVARIEAVARDHAVLVAEGTRTFVALAALEYVRPR